MYKMIFSTAEIENQIEEYIFLFNKNIYLNLYYANNYFSKIMFRDVYKENNYSGEDIGDDGGLDIWIIQCTHYDGPMALKNVKNIVFTRRDTEFEISIKSEFEKIDLQCCRLEIYQHNQNRVTFFPTADRERLFLFDRKGQIIIE